MREENDDETKIACHVLVRYEDTTLKLGLCWLGMAWLSELGI